MSGHLMVEPSDVAPGSAHLEMLHAHMIHSDKPLVGSGEGRGGAIHTMEMLSILHGEDVGEKPLTLCLINPLSPLGYSTELLDALLVYAEHKQPIVIASLIMAGSTGPITLSGTLAVQNAELLAGIVLAQLLQPGVPVVIGSTSTNIDMKSGALAIGGPELSMVIIAHAQLARHYGIPSRSGGSLTDSSTPDAQAGFESMFSMLTTVNSGVDFVLHTGGILSSYLAFSYEKLVLDDEMCGMLKHYLAGIDVTADTLAYEVSARVGPGSNYLTEMHTVERCRSEFWTPSVSDRSGLDVWMDGGREDALIRARRRWRKLVAEHEDPPWDATTARQLSEYVASHRA
jgi:trimethylamine--corrinoid protein Co-methyltransferase